MSVEQQGVAASSSSDAVHQRDDQTSSTTDSLKSVQKGLESTTATASNIIGRDNAPGGMGRIVSEHSSSSARQWFEQLASLDRTESFQFVDGAFLATLLSAGESLFGRGTHGGGELLYL